jgi:hypothetical protein
VARAGDVAATDGVAAQTNRHIPKITNAYRTGVQLDADAVVGAVMLGTGTCLGLALQAHPLKPWLTEAARFAIDHHATSQLAATHVGAVGYTGSSNCPVTPITLTGSFSPLDQAISVTGAIFTVAESRPLALLAIATNQ